MEDRAKGVSSKAVAPPKPANSICGVSLRSRIILQDKAVIEDEIVCVGCNEILYEPKACINCEQYYCQACITNLTKSPRNCECGSILRTKNVHKLVKKILSNYKFKCSFAQNGCAEAVPYDSLLQHDELCLYRPVRCEHELCDEAVLKKDFNEHMISCPYKKANCCHCKSLFLHYDLPAHQEKCDKRLISCDGCLKDVYQIEFKNHHATCDFIKEQCSQCDTVMIRKDMKSHTPLLCINHRFKIENQVVSSELASLKTMISGLTQKLRTSDRIFSLSCANCKRLSCQAYTGSCRNCKARVCFLCLGDKYQDSAAREDFACAECQKPAQAYVSWDEGGRPKLSANRLSKLSMQ